jgi:hypothetical protein
MVRPRSLAEAQHIAQRLAVCANSHVLSVVLTEEGERLAHELLQKHFGRRA